MIHGDKDIKQFLDVNLQNHRVMIVVQTKTIKKHKTNMKLELNVKVFYYQFQPVWTQ